MLYFFSTVPGVSSCPIQKPRYPVTDLINNRHFGFWADAQVNNAAGFSRNVGDHCPDLLRRSYPPSHAAHTNAAISDFFACADYAFRSRAGSIILRISLNSNSEFNKNLKVSSARKTNIYGIRGDQRRMLDICPPTAFDMNRDLARYTLLIDKYQDKVLILCREHIYRG